MAHVDDTPRTDRADVGRIVGQLRLRVDNLEDGFNFTTTYQAVTGGARGARSGYATLAGAVRDLQAASEGHTPAVAVLERGGRFYGHELRGRDLDAGLLRSPAGPMHLESDEMSEPLELRATLRHERLRAVVDGTLVHRFR